MSRYTTPCRRNSASTAGLVDANADQTERHHASMAASRSGPSGAARTSMAVMEPRRPTGGESNAAHE